jgi:CubicO group peptidase (beta-lactamase class C family)
VTTQPLPTSTPAEQGVDSGGIARFLDALEADPRIDPHGIVIIRHGAIVAEGWWSPYTADRLHLLYSLSKTFTSTALGFAVAEGLVDLDDFVVDHFPEFAHEIGPRSATIRVRHVAAMASGHTQEMVEAAFETDPHEPVRGFLLHEPEREPGSVFTYNQPCTYTVAAIVQRATGLPLTEYLRPRLFEPIGIGEVSWQQYPPGRDIGFSGLHATTDAIARLGLLYLQGGRWDGHQVLPEGWAGEVRARHVDTSSESESDWRLGYGLQVWLSRHGYRGDGAYGQFTLVLPDHDAVVAITEASTATQATLDAVWEHLVPAFGAGPLDGAGDAALEQRLAGLSLPATQGHTEPAGDAQGWEGNYTGEPGSETALVAISLSAENGGWTAVLEDGSRRLVLPVGAPGWTSVEGQDGALPVAVSGGWTDDGLLRLDLLFLETPHRLFVELRSDTRRFSTRWGTEPLRLGVATGLLELAAPRPFSG